MTVRIRYRRCATGGWSYTIMAACGLRWLGEGWSAGKKRHAEQDVAQRARAQGWVIS